MTPRQFARGLAAEKDDLLKAYFARNSEYAVAITMRSLGLTPAQKRGLRRLMDAAMTDLCYTILLALDGEASLGGMLQQEFSLSDETGNRITGGGELEAAAWQVFHGKRDPR